MHVARNAVSRSSVKNTGIERIIFPRFTDLGLQLSDLLFYRGRGAVRSTFGVLPADAYGITGFYAGKFKG